MNAWSGFLPSAMSCFASSRKGGVWRQTLLADVMTTAPQTVDPDKTFGYALLLMHEHGFRHVPVVEDGKPIGIVSARNALDPEMEEFISEAQRRKHYEETLGS